MTYRKKLIEVSLPLEAINAESAREKSIRKGHISTLHLYWARRPLASCRAVLFAMLVDDPSSVPEEFSTEEEQTIERDRLHRLLEKLVIWKNSNDESILHQARWEIARSIGRDKGIEPPHESNPTKNLGAHNFKNKRDSLIQWIHENGPLIHDPFCGGGSIPLEAQRLGLRTKGGDLNPVAVMITKAATEIPAKFANMPPINPEARDNTGNHWQGANGLAEDVSYYGEWMRRKAIEKIGDKYPDVLITDQMVEQRPDLAKYRGRELKVITWLWARTVPCPDPAFKDKQTPLVKSFILSKMSGKEHWVEPIVEGSEFKFVVHKGKIPENALEGTMLSRSGGMCLLSNSPLPFEYIRKMGRASKIKSRLLSIICEGERERVFLSPIKEHEEIALEIDRGDAPPGETPKKLTGGTCHNYGLTTFGSLFSNRQLLAMNTFSDLIPEVVQHITSQESIVYSKEQQIEYARCVAIYLTFALDKGPDYWTTLSGWVNLRNTLRNTYGRQALPMVWDYAEANPFSSSSGNWRKFIDWPVSYLKNTTTNPGAFICQEDATKIDSSDDTVFFTDPPYYDNIAYADLSDLFYVWMKRNLAPLFPNIFPTILTPKEEEITALKYRRGGKDKAEDFFLNGMKNVIHKMTLPSTDIPVCFYYAFKQQESGTDGSSSTGWSTFLEAIIESGFQIVATVPSRTERSAKLLGASANKLSTSVVLVCRKRGQEESTTRRTEFIRELRQELEPAVRALQDGGISPVDLAQAAIGPGIGVFSKYSVVMEADGSHMSVRRALEFINEELSVILGETDEEIDAESRVCLRWFSSFGESSRVYGEFETVRMAMNASKEKIEKSGCMIFVDGKVRIAEIDSYPESFNPKDVGKAPAWAHVHRLIRLLDIKGEREAAAYMRNMPSHQRDSVRSLTYRLYQICDEKKMMKHAKNYNTLAVSWGQVSDRSQKSDKEFRQRGLDEFEEEGR